MTSDHPPFDVAMRVPDSDPMSDVECTALLQWMLRHDTTARQGREAGFMSEFQRFLKARGIASDIFPGDAGRTNLVATIDGSRPGPHLVFCGHCDTVPLGERSWDHDPLGGAIFDGRIYGRGSCDMKGGLAALTASFLDLAAMDPAELKGRLSLAITYGEESGSEGARVMALDGSLGAFDAMIIAEPTANRVVRSHKGALWLQADASGRTGHGSMPSTGINAICMLIALAERMKDLPALQRRDPLLGTPTLCLTRLEGGTQVNVIPDRAVAEFDLRTLPGQQHDAILAEVQTAARAVEAEVPGGRITVQVMTSLPALDTPSNSPLVRALEAARQATGLPAQPAGGASYFTDGSVLQRLGAVVILGPGDPAQAHQTDEYLNLADLHAARRIYARLAREYGLTDCQRTI